MMICPFVRVWFLEETFQFCACSHLISIKAEEIISNPHCHQSNHTLNDICIRLITKKCLWWRLCHALHIVVVIIYILFINKFMLFLSGGGWGNLHNYTYGKKNEYIHSLRLQTSPLRVLAFLWASQRDTTAVIYRSFRNSSWTHFTTSPPTP